MAYNLAWLNVPSIDSILTERNEKKIPPIECRHKNAWCNDAMFNKQDIKTNYIHQIQIYENVTVESSGMDELNRISSKLLLSSTVSLGK